MKPFRRLCRAYLDLFHTYRSVISQFSRKQLYIYTLSTFVLALLIVLPAILLIINLLMFVTFIKVWIVYGALIGYGFIHLVFFLQTQYIKDYSNDLEFVKIRRLFKIHAYTYGILWFGFVYGLYQIFGGYII